MTLFTILILMVVGLFAGAFSGLVGVGGGIIIIPALLYILGMSQHDAQGTSMAILLPPIGLMAAYTYYKAGHVNVYYAAIIAATFFVGSYFGAKYAIQLPAYSLKKIFAIFLLILGLKLLFEK
jgi:uncharacterized membrane protein YfcA